MLKNNTTRLIFTCLLAIGGMLFFCPEAAAQHAPVPRLNTWQIDSVMALANRNSKNVTNRSLVAKGADGLVGFGPKGAAHSMARGHKGDGVSCFDTAGRFSLKWDGYILYTNDAVVAADGNLLVTGECYELSSYKGSGYVLKCDVKGNVLWAKNIDSTVHSRYEILWYYHILELSDKTILLVGSTPNYQTDNYEPVFTRLSASGNVIWNNIYRAKIWRPGMGSSDNAFNLTDVKEDPYSGDLFFCNSFWANGRCITRLNKINGRVVWSKSWDLWDYSNFDQPFGLDLSRRDELVCFGRHSSYSNAIISGYLINKANGDTLLTRSWEVTDTAGYNRVGILTAQCQVKNTDGSYTLAGKLHGSYQYPYTGAPFYHAGVVEIDSNLNFVKAYSFRSRRQSNTYNSAITVFPDRSGLFSMLEILSGYSANVVYVQFQNGQIIKDRVKYYNGEGLPSENRSLRLPDNSDMIIKLAADSTNPGYGKVEFLNLHAADSSSACLGVTENEVFVQPYTLGRSYNYIKSITDSMFRVSANKAFVATDFTADLLPGCTQTSICDTFQLAASGTTFCVGDTLQLTISKNAECHVNTLFKYDTAYIPGFIAVNDSVYKAPLKAAGEGYVYGITGGCVTLTDSVKVRVFLSPSIINLGPDTTICPGNTLQLHAGPGFASYTWQDNASDSVYTVRTPGEYHVTAKNGCGTAYHDTVTITAHVPAAFDIGADKVICRGDTVSIQAPAGFTRYSWSPDYRLFAVNSQGVKVWPLLDTLYRVSAEEAPGCFVFDSLRVTVNNVPKVQLGADTSICKGDSVVLHAGAGYNKYSWNNGSTAEWVTVRAAGLYLVKATGANNCSSADTLQLLQVYNLPQPDLGTDTVLCKGSSRTLSAGSFTAQVWNTGATTAAVTIRDTGLYAVTVSDFNTCKGRDTLHVNKLVTPPSGFLMGDTAICSYGTLLLTVTGKYQRYLWSTGAAGSTLEITTPGVYRLTVTDAYRCEGKDTITVLRKDCMEGFYIPGVFTPDNDGKNDRFRPLLFGDIEQYEFTIFNRWGQPVFRSNRAGDGWDGTLKNARQDHNMVFVWICRYKLKGHAPEIKKGSVLLLR